MKESINLRSILFKLPYHGPTERVLFDNTYSEPKQEMAPSSNFPKEYW